LCERLVSEGSPPLAKARGSRLNATPSSTRHQGRDTRRREGKGIGRRKGKGGGWIRAFFVSLWSCDSCHPLEYTVEEEFFFDCGKYVRATGLILASTVPLGYLVLLLLLPLFFSPLQAIEIGKNHPDR
jgi:hypothetical protein